MSDTLETPEAGGAHGGETRRGFLTGFLAGAVGAFAGLVPLASGMAFFLGPIVRKRKGGTGRRDAEGYLSLNVTPDALPDDGTPQLFKVYDDVVDAWNKFLNVEVGSVWVRKMPNGQVLAFSSICPHLGCAVDHRSSENDFYCPCHQSAFELDGKKKNDIPPRPMDSLQTKTDAGNRIWVKYQAFRSAIPEKVPV